jgi:DUF4097 and DUF4098 domain-containing protein YvlB
MKSTRTILLSLLSLAVLCPRTSAQFTVERRQPASAHVEVRVENAFGSIEIVGWDQAEVLVSGTLAAGVEDFDVDAEESEIDVQVSVPDAWMYESDDDSEYRSQLVLQVPHGATISVESLNADVTIRNVNGPIEIESVNGGITIEGAPPTIEIETMTGAVDVRAARASMEVESISGAVSLRGVAGQAEVNTVSGDVDIEASELNSLEVETTAGNVRVAADVAARGGIEIETFSGRVELILPAATKAQFELVTFEGRIESELGPSTSSAGRFSPFRKVRFSTGVENEISVQTYSGDIALRTGER